MTRLGTVSIAAMLGFVAPASAAGVGDVMDVHLFLTAKPVPFTIGCSKWEDVQELFQFWSKGQLAALEKRRDEISALTRRGDDLRICKGFRSIVDPQRIVQKRPDSDPAMAWFCITPVRAAHIFDERGNPIAPPACWWIRYPENPDSKK